MTPGLLGAILASVLGAALPAAVRVPGLPLRRVADIPLPGRPTRFDYESLDPSSGRLYISHMGDGRLIVVDTRRGRVIADLAGYPYTTGVLAVPALGRVYSSAPGGHEVVVTDARTLEVLARVRGGRFPDGLAYAPPEGRIFVSDEAGRQVLVVDARTDRLIRRLPLGGEVGNCRYDPARGRILALVQTRGELVEIDPRSCRVVARHPLPGGRGPHGLLLAGGRVFAACEDDARLLVVSPDGFRVLAVLPTGPDPDVLAWDPAYRLLYVGCEGDVVSVFRLGAGGLRKLGDDPVGRDCHGVCVDPATHRVYVPLVDVGGRPVLRVLEPDATSGGG